VSVSECGREAAVMWDPAPLEAVAVWGKRRSNCGGRRVSQMETLSIVI